MTSALEFGGIIASDNNGSISPKGEIVTLMAWPLVGEWTADSPELKALQASYLNEGIEASIAEDKRGVHLRVPIMVASSRGVRAAERRLAVRMFDHLKIGAIIQ